MSRLIWNLSQRGFLEYEADASDRRIRRCARGSTRLSDRGAESRDRPKALTAESAGGIVLRGLVMSKRRQFGWALLLSLGTTLLATPAQSHKGDERSQGCHTDRRTGEYHCHTPKTPQPPTEVTLSYCHVVYGQRRCGQTSGECAQLVSQFGGSCQQQLGFSVR